MQGRVESIVSEYQGLFACFEEATKVFECRVKEIVNKSNIEILDITSRPKKPNSLDGKLRTKRGENLNRLQDLSDLSGVCVVVYFEDDIKPLIELLGNSFTGLTSSDSIDKMGLLDPDRFGYRAHHLNIGLVENLNLTTGCSDSLSGFKGEIQVRTAFMNSWAKIEHTYNYKASIGSPIVKRGFARLASLVELADQELCLIHRWFLTNEETIVSTLTLSGAVSGSENQKLLKELAKAGHRVPEFVGATESELQQTQTLLRIANFSDIGEVRASLLARQHALFSAMNRYFDLEADIRPQNPIDFLAFHEALERRGPSGLVDLVGESMAFEEDIDLLAYCKDVISSFSLT